MAASERDATHVTHDSDSNIMRKQSNWQCPGPHLGALLAAAPAVGDHGVRGDCHARVAS